MEVSQLDEIVLGHVEWLVVVERVSKSLNDCVEVSDVLELESVLLVVSLDTKVVLVAIRLAKVGVHRSDLAEVDFVVWIGLSSVLMEADDVPVKVHAEPSGGLDVQGGQQFLLAVHVARYDNRPVALIFRRYLEVALAHFLILN